MRQVAKGITAFARPGNTGRRAGLRRHGVAPPDDRPNSQPARTESRDRPALAAVRKGIGMVLANFDAWLDRTLRNHEKLRKLAWFVIIYGASVVVFGIIAFGLQALVPA
ncbi:hypothetical protein [Acidiphilium sp.]|uniref:hypothetical protein n=1 Tax=Acidiphilium sp. TaxID=527 RepID=UPI00258E03A5|nr:hypothetical protein [Acidiphilium sp.]MBU6355707.1 DUF2474 family protein [Rhodospirillales bacterium]